MPGAFAYEGRRPERTTLYEVLRDNVETLHEALSESGTSLPGFVREELEGCLDCGLLCRGFAHLKCEQVGPMSSRGGEPRSKSVYAHSLVQNLVERGLKIDRRILCVIDGGKGIRKALCDVLGSSAVIQRCQVHKTRNVRDILRPPVAQERIVQGPDGLVRIALKKPFSDGTVAIDLDPLSLLLRLCAAMPAPRFHTIRYAGVLASAAKLRPKIIPKPAAPEGETEPVDHDEPAKKKGCRYWPWAELMARSFELDVTKCPRCEGRLVLVALVKEEASAARFAKSLGEPTAAPARSPPRPPPYFRSPVIRRLTGNDLAVA